MEEKRCKNCGLSAEDVLYPENFWLNEEGLCNICTFEKYQVIPDYRSQLQKFLNNLAVGEPNEKFDKR